MPTTMKPEIRDKWADALESGQYRQGRAGLRSEADEFCCLGVLCDLFRKETGRGEWEVPTHNMVGFPFVVSDATRDSVYLPTEVQQWAGLDHFNPELPNGEPAAHLNDIGTPFPEIAALIRELPATY